MMNEHWFIVLQNAFEEKEHDKLHFAFYMEILYIFWINLHFWFKNCYLSIPEYFSNIGSKYK